MEICLTGKKIGYVSQQVFLLDDTVTNNIGFGFNDEDIDIGKVHKVLKDVQLYDYFNYQEKKFQTIVGERRCKIIRRSSAKDWDCKRTL